MAEIDEIQKRFEEQLTAAVTPLLGRGEASDWALVRAMIHKAVHMAAEREVAEFCGLATFLADMIGHAHGLMHPADRSHDEHGKPVH